MLANYGSALYQPSKGMAKHAAANQLVPIGSVNSLCTSPSLIATAPLLAGIF
jgi:hypothetical protein